jgi:hypothetical protein
MRLWLRLCSARKSAFRDGCSGSQHAMMRLGIVHQLQTRPGGLVLGVVADHGEAERNRRCSFMGLVARQIA